MGENNHGLLEKPEAALEKVEAVWRQGVNGGRSIRRARARRVWQAALRAGRSSRCCVSTCATSGQGFSGSGSDSDWLILLSSWRLTSVVLMSNAGGAPIIK